MIVTHIAALARHLIKRCDVCNRWVRTKTLISIEGMGRTAGLAFIESARMVCPDCDAKLPPAAKGTDQMTAFKPTAFRPKHQQVVLAVRVSTRNLDAAARWCNGRVVESDVSDQRHIRFSGLDGVARLAYSGDVIVLYGYNYSPLFLEVLPASTFGTFFEPAS